MARVHVEVIRAAIRYRSAQGRRRGASSPRRDARSVRRPTAAE
ncbi:Hypothetical protein PFR_JS13-2_1772 [Propionibacterium freudenreichii]|uniref:Uncharacterized protein n=1 Tax=Propionibacterium freudenreichii TaxID=1744 RepID=A0A2C7ZHU7_9ACTN|nr:Hypothetical protein RM25_0427 [Propionibacterium freudenreichii subsp. freudenreichii]SBM43915.1 Hypothetical protein PFR_JS2_1756 [Propionibacterium freudenreichii]SPB30414.1 hypothetical protein MAJHIDBO_00719 [Propionibacterium freudenreichii subsp. shermanii]SBN43196.1 Hypothetical protein PFR_J18_858 [Propionibacterium freudenreichii]SBN53109.1 Hypothetical protein PFR_JS8_1846 [Propionibacterium freudenreichii]